LDLRAGLAVAVTLALLALAGSAFVIFFRLRAEREREEELARRARTRRLPVAAGKIGDLESDTDPSMLATGEHLTARRFAVTGDEDDGEYGEGDGWNDDEGPGPDWQPRPMTGSMPIFADESYPRALNDQDAESTDASTSTASETTDATDAGATVASATPSEDDEPTESDSHIQE
jgi:hypothetical protein